MSQHDGTPEELLRRESRRRRSAIGLFVAATFGMMALVSAPFSPLARFHIPTPIERAVLGPVESLLQPLFEQGPDQAAERADASVAEAARGGTGVAVGITRVTGDLAPNGSGTGHKPTIRPAIKSPRKDPIPATGEHAPETVLRKGSCASRLRCEARPAAHRHRAH